MPRTVGMPVKQQAFVRQFVVCGNATQAARDAGYKRPGFTGWRLLQSEPIKRAIAEAQKSITDDSIADATERRRLWTAILRSEDYEVKDRLKASELLGKASGDFIERREITNPDGSLTGPVVINVIGVGSGRPQDT